MDHDPFAGVLVDADWSTAFGRLESGWGEQADALAAHRRLAATQSQVVACDVVEYHRAEWTHPAGVRLRFSDGTDLRWWGVEMSDAVALEALIADPSNVVTVAAPADLGDRGWALRLTLRGAHLGPAPLLVEAAALS